MSALTAASIQENLGLLAIGYEEIFKIDDSIKEAFEALNAQLSALIKHPYSGDFQQRIALANKDHLELQQACFKAKAELTTQRQNFKLNQAIVAEALTGTEFDPSKKTA